MKRRAPRLAELDVSSFSDIAFLLIIFFILTTSMNRPTGRMVDMPSASQPEAREQDTATPTVSILSDRILFGAGKDDDREVTLSELREALRAKDFGAATDSDRMVAVNLAADVAYERYFRVVTLISETGGIIAMLTE